HSKSPPPPPPTRGGEMQDPPRRGREVGTGAVTPPTPSLPLSTGILNPTTALAVAAPPPLVQIVNSNLSLWSETVLQGYHVLHVVGEVQNNDLLRNAQNILVDCNLSNGGVALNVEARDSTEVEVLQPSEKSSCDVLFFNPPPADGASCVVTNAPSPLQPNHNFTAAITSVATGSDGFQHVMGTVQNNNAFAVSNARLAFTFYLNSTDNPLQTIAEDRLFVNNSGTIAPGAVSPFDLARVPLAQPAWTWNGLNAALLVEAPVPVVQLNPASITLSQQITRSAAPQVITLTNVGTGDLHIGTVSFAGANPGDWSETDTCAGLTLAASYSC